MGPVEDSYGAAPRAGDMDAPKKVMRQVILTGPSERGYAHAERTSTVKYLADRPILPTRIGPLEHH